MTPQEMQELAELLQTVPGIKSIDLKDVRKLAQLLRESPEIGSIEVKGWFGTGVVITRTSNTTHAATVLTPMPMPMGTVPVQRGYSGEAHPPGAPPAQTALKEIRSPMVGTFYRAPEPGAEPYVQVGSRISSGQTVCIIEAMKIMNEIEADKAGTITQVLAQNGQAVEFGQPLFVIE